MITRRNCLELAALGAGLALRPAAAAPQFELPELPYAYDALEPAIDAKTMEIHYGKHHQTYVTNLNKAVAAEPRLAGMKLEDMLTRLDQVPAAVRAAVRNSGGGHANHTLFWQCLAPAGKGGKPTGKLAAAIGKAFGSQQALEEKLRTAAVGVFGSGWAWLSVDGQNRLLVEATANQDSPLSAGHKPLLGIDVWEHAYYLKYQNRRADYLAALGTVLNWQAAGESYGVLAR